MKPNPEQMAEAVVELFTSSQESPELMDRMAFAQTIVEMHFVGPDDTDAACTVWLDRIPLEARLGTDTDAEVEITGPVDVWLGMIGGQIDMAMAIVRGELTYVGPVRKFLRVVPILQSFDFAAFRGTRLDESEREFVSARSAGVASADETAPDGRTLPPPPPPM
jgi:putative sterol carrier protein